MKRVHENLESKDFEKPKGITQATVCSKSGLLPKDGVCENDPRGSLKYTEYFASGTTPKEECNHHEVLSIRKVSGEDGRTILSERRYSEKSIYCRGSTGTLQIIRIVQVKSS